MSPYKPKYDAFDLPRLCAHLDKDEAIARAAGAMPGTDDWRAEEYGVYEEHGITPIAVGPYDGDIGDVGVHVARHDPARVLREVAAKRKLAESLVTWRPGDRVTAERINRLNDRIMDVLFCPYPQEGSDG